MNESRLRILRALRVVALVTLVGCTDSPAQPTAGWDPAATLSGRWVWVRSQRVQDGTVATPGSAGFSAEIEFTRETATSGVFRFTRSDGDAIEGRFDIGAEHGPGTDFIVIEPGITFLTRAAWVTAGGDSLRLGGVFEGGYNSTYARLR